MSVSPDSGSLEAVAFAEVVVAEVVVAEVVVAEVVVAEVVAVGSGSLEVVVVVGSGSLEVVVVVVAFVAFVAFVASAIAVAAKTAVAVQESNLLKTEADLVQEPKWDVAFAAAVVVVAIVEPDSRDASLPLKWKPNCSLDRD
jgi:hypothetical protein